MWCLYSKVVLLQPVALLSMFRLDGCIVRWQGPHVGHRSVLLCCSDNTGQAINVRPPLCGSIAVGGFGGLPLPSTCHELSY
jgi:hypothetical protein